MSWDHDRVEELLAAHALDGLDSDDAALAERALVEHVPECDRCRRAWDGYREVASDLALAAAPLATSETLDARVTRAVAGERTRSRPSPLAATAAGVIAILVGVSGFSMLRTSQLEDQVDQAEANQTSILGTLSTVVHPEHETVLLSGPGEEAAALYYVPGEPQGYLMAANLPPPRHAYHVWFVDDGDVWHAGTLRIRGGRGVLPCRTDPNRWDAVMLTDEPRHPSPRNSPVVSASVSPAP